MSLFLLSIRRCSILAYWVVAIASPLCGYAAPDVWLEGVDGEKHNLNEFIGQGKWTALNIWGTSCPPCLEEMPELIHFHDEHKDTNAIVVGIAIDFPSFGYAKKDQVIEFMDQHLVDYTVLLSDASISRKIGAGVLEGLPTTYLYTPKGELAIKQVGRVTRRMLETFINQYRNRDGAVIEMRDKKNE